jgi:iron complex outermembrane receptor protein
VPGYARVDAGVSYEHPKNERWKYRFSFNANNLLNRRYFFGASGRFAVYPGSRATSLRHFNSFADN